MTDDSLVAGALRPTGSWTDTPEQQLLRDHLIHILQGHDEITTMRLANDMITVMRDQLSAAAATVRRRAAWQARHGLHMRPGQIADASGLSYQTVSRLLTEAPRDDPDRRTRGRPKASSDANIIGNVDNLAEVPQS